MKFYDRIIQAFGRTLGALLLVSTAALASGLRFDVPPRDFAAGNQPIAVVAGDFNRDGTTDLAVSDQSSVTILLGVGHGQFASPVTYQNGGSQPWNIVTADFNNDGFLDLAVGEGNGIIVMLGNGDGTFRMAPVQPSLSRAYYVVAGDFNRDGKVDLAATDAPAGAVHVLFGNGDGTFTVGKSIAATSEALGLAVADVNGDRRLDLVVEGNDAVAILMGEGNGTFAPAVSYPINQLNGPVSVGDLNGDGLPDIVVTSVQGITVLLGTGGGKFGSPLPAFGSDATERIAIADLNGDGIMDLAAPFFGQAGSVQIYLGKGDGTFSADAAIPVGSSPYWAIAAHVNSGKALDLVTANDVAGSVSVLLGNGDGTFGQLPISLGVGASGASGIASGDVNGDGILDLVTSNANTNNISVLLGKGNGRFTAAKVFPAGGQPESIALADFNGDGKLDVVTANFSSGTISVLFGNGDGTFQAPQNHSAGIQTQSVVTGDMNNDGIPDIVVASVQSATITTLLSNGDGTFKPAITYFVNNGFAGATQIVLADINGDGNLDVVAQFHFGSGMALYTGNGDGSISDSGTCVCNVAYPWGLAVGDFNQDGLPDVAYGMFSNNLLGASLNTGQGRLGPAMVSPAPVSPTLLGIGDFDGDGHLDAVSTGLGSNVLSFAMGSGDGTFTLGPSYPSGGPTAVAVGDFNSDGRLDVAVAQPNGVVVLLNATR